MGITSLPIPRFYYLSSLKLAMQSYTEVYSRYFDPKLFAPGSPKTMKRELPRASAYQALISLKYKYHLDSKQPLDVNDLPTSDPLFDNYELLDQAEQTAMDWTLQHPGLTNSPMSVQDESRRQAQKLWKIWTESNRSKNRFEEPSMTMPRRASDSVVSPSPSQDGRRVSMPFQQQQNWNGSVPLYDQETAEPVACNTVPTNRTVPAPVPIQNDVRPPASTFPIASDYPTTDNKQPIQAGKVRDNVPPDSETADISASGSHTPTNAMATGAGAAGLAAGVKASGAGSSSEASSSRAPWDASGKKIDFAEETRKDQIKKELQSKNTGGTRERVAEQPQVSGQGGLTGTQPVGKIDLKSL